MSASGAAVLSGRYALAEVIGRGGMADVYRAEDQLLARSVAVKILRSLTSDPSARARFTAEAKMLARLNHPGLVTLLDAGTDGDRPYLVMDLVEGTTLADCCNGETLDPPYVAAVATPVADALAYVHDRGIVHRDLKPGNILLGDDGRVLLADFGVAKLLSDAAPLTATGFTMGTAAYLAPEQVRRTDVGPAADVYSLGLVLLEALTGERAYPGPPSEAAVARLAGPPAIPDSLPAPWRGLLHQMTAVDPADRPRMADVAARLRELAGGDHAIGDPTAPTARLREPATPTRPLTVRVGSPGRRPFRRRPLVLSAAVALAVLLLGLAAALLTNGGQAGPDGATDIPTNVPADVTEELQDLHEAVNG